MNHIQPQTGRIARTMQAVWLLELCGFALAAWLMRRNGLGVGAITSALAAWFFGFRALIVAEGFRNGERRKYARKPEHQIGFFAGLRLYLAEYLTTVLAFNVLFPLERWLMPQAPLPAAPGRRTPVVLVHGFICNRAYWWFFVRALERARLGPVYAVTLEPVFGCIDEKAQRLGALIEEICAQTGAPQVALVGHSMGGLISRSYLHNGGASRIDRIITLGTPHHGTYGAYALRKLATNAEQMCIKSPWMTAGIALQTRDCPVPITSILTPHDNIVYPQDSAELRYPNARTLYFPGLGHVELLFSKKVMRQVIEELSR